MSQNDATAIVKADVPEEFGWHNREEVKALAGRIRAMMPGDLGKEEALLLAQYSAAMDANPYRGEIYAFKSQGKLVLTEGYKLLVRWARRQCNFSDRYFPMDPADLPEGAIGHTCHVLREDMKATLFELVRLNVPWKEAFDLVSQSASGIVTAQEQVNAPPKGWSWHDVARKRALKNALNIAYGSPSPREMAKETWIVDDVETVADDWESPDPLLAKANAQDRERRGRISERSGPGAHSDLYGDEPEWLPPEADPETGEIIEQVDVPNVPLGDFPENPDIEGLSLMDGSFQDAVIAEMPHYKHSKHISNALTKELGQGWGGRYSKSHLWEVLRARVETEGQTEMELEATDD